MDDGGLGIRNWGGYYDHQPAVKGLGLNLMSNMAAGEGDTKPLLPNGTFLHRDCGALPDHPVSMQYNNWIRPRDGNRILHVMPNYTMLSDPQASGNPQTLQMLQPPDSAPVSDAAGGRKEGPPSKKRSQGGRRNSAPRAKKPKKTPAPRDEMGEIFCWSSGKRCEEELGDCDQRDKPGYLRAPDSSLLLHGHSSAMLPLGHRWVAVSLLHHHCFDVPASNEHEEEGGSNSRAEDEPGAFKKVLEKLAGEGYNLSNPIDLSAHWAKHGTNKYVTIR